MFGRNPTCVTAWVRYYDFSFNYFWIFKFLFHRMSLYLIERHQINKKMFLNEFHNKFLISPMYVICETIGAQVFAISSANVNALVWIVEASIHFDRIF